MFSVKIVQNVKLIELWGKNLAPLNFVISKSYFFLIFPIGHNGKVRVIQIQRIMTMSKIFACEPIKFHKISTEMGMETLSKLFMRKY